MDLHDLERKQIVRGYLVSFCNNKKMQEKIVGKESFELLAEFADFIVEKKSNVEMESAT